MRNILIIGMLLVAAFMAGWFKIQRDGERTTIEINRAEIRDDAKRALNRGKDFMDRREQEFDNSGYASGNPSGQDNNGYDPRYAQPANGYPPNQAGNYDANDPQQGYPGQPPYANPNPNSALYYNQYPVEYSGQAPAYPAESQYPRR